MKLQIISRDFTEQEQAVLAYLGINLTENNSIQYIEFPGEALIINPNANSNSIVSDNNSPLKIIEKENKNYYSVTYADKEILSLKHQSKENAYMVTISGQNLRDALNTNANAKRTASENKKSTLEKLKKSDTPLSVFFDRLGTNTTINLFEGLNTEYCSSEKLEQDIEEALNNGIGNFSITDNYEEDPELQKALAESLRPASPRPK